MGPSHRKPTYKNSHAVSWPSEPSLQTFSSWINLRKQGTVSRNILLLYEKNVYNDGFHIVNDDDAPFVQYDNVHNVQDDHYDDVNDFHDDVYNVYNVHGVHDDDVDQIIYDDVYDINDN